MKKPLKLTAQELTEVADRTLAYYNQHSQYQQARAQHPKRWSGDIRNWMPVGAVSLNPEREEVMRKSWYKTGFAQQLP